MSAFLFGFGFVFGALAAFLVAALAVLVLDALFDLVKAAFVKL